MKFTKDEIKSCVQFIDTAISVVNVMPEYGELVGHYDVLDSYIDAYPKAKNHKDVDRNELVNAYDEEFDAPDKAGILKQFKELTRLAKGGATKWDVTLATALVSAVDNTIKKKTQFSSADFDRVSAIKCAIAFAKYLPESVSVVSRNLKHLMQFCEVIQPIKTASDKVGLDKDIANAAKTLYNESNERLEELLEELQNQLQEVK